MIDYEIKRITNPAIEPIDLDSEMKPHLRVDIRDDDLFIESLMAAAREYVEDVTRRSLITQTWRLWLPSWPTTDSISLPMPPLQSVSSLKYTDKDGTITTWDSSNYIVDTNSHVGQLVLAYGVSWPSSVVLYPVNPIEVEFVTGYGSAEADVPRQLKQAIKLLVGHWYENREATIEGTITREVPFSINSIIHLNRAY